MVFEKDMSIIFNRRDLANAIENHTSNPKEKYKVTIRNNYPCICIGHEHHYIHRLLGEYYFGDLTGYAIHHIDGDKKNNAKENLMVITSSEHTKLHHKGKDFRSKSGITASVNAMAKSKRRDDVNVVDVRKAREDGLTYKELTKKFKCGNSVIRRCLLDWSDIE